MVLYCKASLHTKLTRINVCSELELQQGYLATQSTHACTAQDKLWHLAIATKLHSVTSKPLLASSVTSKPLSENIYFLTDEHSEKSM
jgi:thymidine phosphorylase